MSDFISLTQQLDDWYSMMPAERYRLYQRALDEWEASAPKAAATEDECEPLLDDAAAILRAVVEELPNSALADMARGWLWMWEKA